MVPDAILGWAIGKIADKGLHWILKNGGSDYDVELAKLITETIEEYNDGATREYGKIFFYESETLRLELIKARLTNEFDKDKILSLIQSDNRIQETSISELEKFLHFFDSKFRKSEKLKNLYIESNYKEKIFEIDQLLKQTFSDLNTSVSKIKNILESQASEKLFNEWRRQLDEIVETIEKFKPKSAFDRLISLEDAIAAEGISNNHILSNICYLKARCISEIKPYETDIEESKLLIKAYSYNRSDQKFKSYAAIAYLVLGEASKSQAIVKELLEIDEYNVMAWVADCISGNENFRERLKAVPEVVRKDKSFRFKLSHWAWSRKYFIDFSEIGYLGLAYDEDFSEPIVINYSNIYFYASKAAYFLNNFFERDKTHLSALFYPNAKKDHSFVSANKILENIHYTILQTEIESNYLYYSFQYFSSLFILTEDLEQIEMMQAVFDKIETKSTDLTITLAKAYGYINSKESIEKGLRILNHYGDSLNPLIILMKCSFYSILQDEENTIVNYISFLRLSTAIDREKLLNTQLFIRRGKFLQNQKLVAEFENIANTYSFEETIFRDVFLINLYQACKIGFVSDEVFRENLFNTLECIDSLETPFFLAIIHGFLSIKEIDTARQQLKKRLNVQQADEIHFLYCSTLYLLDGFKSELIELLTNWRKNLTLNEELLRLEIYLQKLNKNWEEVVNIARLGLEAFESHKLFLFDLIIGLSQTKKSEEIRELRNQIISNDWTDDDEIAFFSETLADSGFNQDALDFAYKYARDKHKKKVRFVYAFGNKILRPELVNDFSEVVEGAFVKYKIDNQINFTHITKDNIHEFPANILLGKKVADNFSISLPVTGELITGEILRICDKYLFLAEEIFTDLSNPMSGSGLQSIKVDFSSFETITNSFIDLFGARGTFEQDQSNKYLSDYYKNGDSFMGFSAKIFRRNMYNAYYFLTRNGGRYFRCKSHFYSKDIVVDKNYKYVLDLATVFLFYELWNNLNFNFNEKFIIATSTKTLLDEYYELLFKENSSSVNLIITNDGLVLNKVPENKIESTSLHIKDILKWIEDNCIIESSPRKIDLLMSLGGDKRNDIFSHYLVDTLALADREMTVLVSDDLFLMQNRNFLSLNFVSSIKYLELRYSTKIDNVLEWMISSNYIGIPINATILKNEYYKMLSDTNNKFHVCLENLRFILNPLLTNISQAVKFLKEVYLSPAISDNNKSIVTSSIFMSLSEGITQHAINFLDSELLREFSQLSIAYIEVVKIRKQFFF